MSAYCIPRWMLAAALLLPNAAFAQAVPSPFTSGVRYDVEHRLTGTLAPDPDGSGPLHHAATRTTYDAAGRPIKVEKGELASWQDEGVAPAAWSGFNVFSRVETAYDVMDRKIVESVWSGNTAYGLTQFSYDLAGRLECTAVRMNPATYASLPANACLLGAQGAQGAQGPDRIVRTVYDTADQVVKVQKAYGVTTANGFPATLQQDYATFTYSVNGKPVSMTDANGNVAGMRYDGFDRQDGWFFPDKTNIGAVSASDYEAYGYDTNGNRTSLRKRDGRTIEYSYDALNRVTVKNVNGTCAAGYACTTPPASAVRDVYYGYDLQGLQTYARFGSAAGEGVSNVYDGFGRLTSSSTTLGGVSRTVGSSNYDADGNRGRLTHPDGVWFDAVYDGLDRMTAESWKTPGPNAAMPFFGIVYNAQGQRLETSRGSGLTAYEYDGVSRLLSLSQAFSAGSADTTGMFKYNAANQITQQTRSNLAYAYSGYATASTGYAVNGLNQYTGVGAGSLGYDANGNLASNGGTSFTYDVENRLVSAVGTLNLELVYDPLGRLWQTSGGAYGRSQFVYDGDRMVAEYDGDSGAMRRRFAYGPGTDEPVLWDEGGALNCTATRFLHPDHQGSIVAMANCSGTPVAINTYDEYGVPAASNWSPTSQQRFQYTGQMYLPELGMYYYKARIYSARLGRFLQTDPIGYKDQNNLYAYVANDPVNGTDPTGLCEGEYCTINVAHPELDRQVSQTKYEIGKNAAPAWYVTTAAVASYFLAGPAISATADAMFARTGASTASRATQGFNLPQAIGRAVDRVVNIGRNNASVKDFLGTARESAGKPTGFNHIKEMQQSIRGLEKSSEAIGKAMADSRTGQAAREGLGRVKDYAESLAQRMRDTLK